MANKVNRARRVRRAANQEMMNLILLTAELTDRTIPGNLRSLSLERKEQFLMELGKVTQLPTTSPE